MGLLACLVIFFGPLAGPFAEPLAYVDFDPVRMIVATAVLAGSIVLSLGDQGSLQAWSAGWPSQCGSFGGSR